MELKVRRNYGMTVLASHDVLVCGGTYMEFFRQLSTCELYSNGTFNSFPSLPVATNNFAMVTLASQPFIFGGFMGLAEVDQ